jgi:hypothetical protein
MADKTLKGKIKAKGTEITVLSTGTPDDFVSLTDIARYKNPEEPNVVVANWLRNRNTIEYLGIWEQLNNPDFKPLEFEGFMSETGANAFTLSPQPMGYKTQTKNGDPLGGRGTSPASGHCFPKTLFGEADASPSQEEAFRHRPSSLFM